MWVMKYEGECIKTLELVESYENWIQFFKMHLPQCYRRCSIESTKQWIWAMNDEGECIKTMEWVELYVNFIKSKQKNALTLLIPKMFYWIEEAMNESNEVCIWVNKNYGMSRIVWKMYWVKTNKCTYLAVPDIVRLN